MRNDINIPSNSAAKLALVLAIALSLVSLHAVAAVPAFSVGSGSDAPLGAPTVTASAPTSYQSGNYVCVVAGAMTGYYGGRGEVFYDPLVDWSAYAPAGYFIQPYIGSAAVDYNTTTWAWSEGNTNNCYATQQDDYGIDTLNATNLGPMEEVAVGVAAPLVSSGGSQAMEGIDDVQVGNDGGDPIYGQFTWTSGSDNYTYSVPKSGDFVVIAIACSGYQCQTPTIPSGCALQGTYSNNWGGSYTVAVGDPTINIYTCNTVAQGSYTVSAAPTTTPTDVSACYDVYENGDAGVDNDYLYPPCFLSESDITAWVFNALPGLNVPTISSNPSAPATMDAGTNVIFTASNIGGGAAPYTVTYTISSTSGTVEATKTYTGISSTSNSFTWAIPSNLAGTPLRANVVVTDSASSTASSSYTGAISVDPSLTVPTISPKPGETTITIDNPNFVPAIMPTGNTLPDNATFTASWSGGTPPYTVYYEVMNSVSDTVMSTQQYTTSGTSNNYTWSAAIPGTVFANVVISDSAATPSRAASTPSGTVTVTGANMIIVTAGLGDQISADDIYDYQNALAGNGLSSLYVEIDNPSQTDPLGQQSVPSGSAWSQYRTTIVGLESSFSANYLLILGDATMIPMPEIEALSGDTLNWDFQTASGTSGLGQAMALIPTDDPYGSFTLGQSSGSPSVILALPTVIVGRMPGNSVNEISTMLFNAADAHDGEGSNSVATNANVAALTDTTHFPGRAFLSSLKGETDDFLEDIGVTTLPDSCSSSNSSGPCYTSPPYCNGLADGDTDYDPVCNSNFYLSSSGMPVKSPNYATSPLANVVSEYGIQFYFCHGSGWDCAGPNDNTAQILSSQSLPPMSTDPIVVMIACFDGEIPGTVLYSPVQSYFGDQYGGSSLPIAMLNNGAVAYIGLTSIGWSTDDAYIAPPFKEFYQPNGVTIGQAYLQAKRVMEASYTADPQTYDQGVSLVFYGDPTLTYSEIANK